MKHYVYCILPKGGHRPCYIGATSNPSQREQDHRAYLREGFSFVVLETLNTAEEASKLESELIVWYLQRGVKLHNKISYPCYKERKPKSEPKPWRFMPPEPPHKPLFDSPELSAFAAAYLASKRI